MIRPDQEILVFRVGRVLKNWVGRSGKDFVFHQSNTVQCHPTPHTGGSESHVYGVTGQKMESKTSIKKRMTKPWQKESRKENLSSKRSPPLN